MGPALCSGFSHTSSHGLLTQSSLEDVHTRILDEEATLCGVSEAVLCLTAGTLAQDDKRNSYLLLHRNITRNSVASDNTHL